MVKIISLRLLLSNMLWLLQMAGVTDVSIVVTANRANRAVSGESALTGVYKALATDGVNINSENTSAANNVLDATQSAIDANKDDKKLSWKINGSCR